MSKKIIKRGVGLGGFIALLALFILPSFAFSQTSPAPDQTIDMSIFNQIQDTANEYLRKSITLDMSPIYPGPTEDVVIKLSSASTDLLRANISWYVDGKLKDGGIGKNTFTLRTRGAGDASVVDVVIKTVEGIRADKRVTINPADLELVWEADSYVPPFYKGKALPTAQGKIKIVALPDFISGNKKLDQKTLVYLWKNEDTDTRLVDNSGYGKNMLYQTMPNVFGNESISVNASSLGNSIKAQKKIFIQPGEVNLLFYESNPVEGIIYENAIPSAFTLTKEDFSVKAEPYFFSNKDRSGGRLSYEWSLGDKKITPDTNEQVTFKQAGDGNGVSLVSLTLRNLANIFEQASGSFTLNFKKEGSSF